jgi:threonine/homoserine/homoserine lactone efflux protein
VPGLLENVLLGSGLAFAAAVQPGPLQAFLLSRVVARGWKHTLPACLAPLLSDGPIAVLAIVIVGRLPPAAQQLLRAAGGGLLLYLALRAYREWREPTRTAPSSAPQTVFQAALVNLLNPNPYLAWALILGPAVIAAWRHDATHALGLVVSFYVTMVATLATLIFLAGAARFLDPGRQRSLVGASALLLGTLGILLLVAAARDAWDGLAGG